MQCALPRGAASARLAAAAFTRHRPSSTITHCITCASCISSSSSSSGGSSSGTGSSRGRHVVCAAAAARSDGGSDGEQQKPLRVERLLANLGYGGRKECTIMLKRKQVVFAATGTPAKVGEKALASQLLLDGEPLDPAPPLCLVLYKPCGFVVTSPDAREAESAETIYDLLPHRFRQRRPFLSSVGRLDKDTSGLLLLTDDGHLLHSIQSPAKGIWKRYTARLAAPLTGQAAAKAAQRFASGQLLLQGDRTPLLPAALTMLDDVTAEVAVCEGRYHQVRRMFAALGNSVVSLHRHAIGGLSLKDEPDLTEGSWRLAAAADIAAVMAGPEFLADVPAARQQQRAAGRQQQQPAGDGAASSSGQQQQQDGEEEEAPAKEEEDEGEDLDHPGEAAASSKRYRDSSKWARRRAALSSRVKVMQATRQQQEQQQRPPASS